MKNIDETAYHSEKFFVRPISDEDKERYREVAKAEYLYGRLYDIDPDASIKVYWETIMEEENDLNYSVFLSSGEFLGRVALQGADREVPELAIIIVKDYQGQEYGKKVLDEWFPWVKKNLGYKRIDIKIDTSNKQSIRMFEKLGAVIDKEDDIRYCHIDL